MVRLLLACLWIVLSAQSVSASTPAGRKPVEVSLGRASGSGCEPDCPEWIFLQGQIVPGTAGEFRRVIQSLKGRKVSVLLNSTGGDVDAGIAIGRALRQAGLNTSVAQTNLPMPCAANDNACRNERRRKPRKADMVFQNALCTSACTFALAGGVNRVLHPASHVGVHQITYFQTYRQVYRTYRIQRKRINGRVVEVSRTLLSERVVSQSRRKLKQVPKTASEQVRQHLLAMGMAPSLNELTVATSADTMRYLNNAERLQHGIATANTQILSALGFDPFNPYFRNGGETSAYTGYAFAGTFQGRPLTLEFSAADDKSTVSNPLSVRLLDGQKVIPSQTVNVELRLPQGPVAEGRMTPAGDGFSFGLPRDQLCALSNAGWTVMTISSKGAESRSEPLKLTRRVFDMMPITGIKQALCPLERWER
jgi:hypothetical protein